jgi:transcriptional regulator with XRE-family HTH domain
MAPVQKRSLADRFPGVLKELRREKRLSQEELAERANLHRTFVSMMERGTSVPTLRTLEQIAVALNVPAWVIVRRLEE